MTIYELRDAKRAMPQNERSRRRRECLDRGGCQSTMAVASGFQEYCTHCLTLYSHGRAQDPPPLTD